MDDGPPYRSIATVNQEATLWVAGLFLSLGFFGFLPGMTANIESLSIWSAASNAELFGLFDVSLLHNAVHLLIGAAALIASGADQRARGFLAAGSIALMMLVIYGQVAVDPVLDRLVPRDPADAWLHGLVAIAMFVVAVCAPPSRRPVGRNR